MMIPEIDSKPLSLHNRFINEKFQNSSPEYNFKSGFTLVYNTIHFNQDARGVKKTAYLC